MVWTRLKYEIVNSLFQYIQHKDGYKLKILTKSRDNLTENLIDEVAHLNDLYHQEKKEISDVIEDVIQNKKKQSLILKQYRLKKIL